MGWVPNQSVRLATVRHLQGGFRIVKAGQSANEIARGLRACFSFDSMASLTFPRRFSAVHLLIALLALFISSPFVQALPHGRLVEGVLFTLVICSALFAVAGRLSVVSGATLAGLALMGQWVSTLWPQGPVGPWYFLPALVFLGFAVVRLMAFVLNAPDVDLETLCASIAGFLMIGLMWALGYTLLDRLVPGSFVVTPAGETLDGFNAFYFSFVTLSTIGYGDITPVSRVARMMAVVEAIVGIFYVAVLVSRLVSIHSAKAGK
jgi:voltage-gated potassium channel